MTPTTAPGLPSASNASSNDAPAGFHNSAFAFEGCGASGGNPPGQHQPVTQMRPLLSLLRVAPVHHHIDRVQRTLEEALISVKLQRVRHDSRPHPPACRPRRRWRSPRRVQPDSLQPYAGISPRFEAFACQDSVGRGCGTTMATIAAPAAGLQDASGDRRTPMQLALSTWHEVEDYLRTSRGIIIPIGSTEQHGPNGLIGTDHLDAEFVAQGRRRRDRLPGRAHAHHRHVAASSGLRRFHHAAAIDADRAGGRRGDLADEARLRALPVHQRPWRQRRHRDRRIRRDLRRLVDARAGRVLAGALQDGVLVAGAAIRRRWPRNCTAMPTAAMPRRRRCRWRSTTIRRRSSTRRCRPRWRRRSTGFFDCADYRRRFPDGRIGSDPSLSTPEHGEQIYQAAVADMIEVYRAFVAD